MFDMLNNKKSDKIDTRGIPEVKNYKLNKNSLSHTNFFVQAYPVGGCLVGDQPQPVGGTRLLFPHITWNWIKYYFLLIKVDIALRFLWWSNTCLHVHPLSKLLCLIKTHKHYSLNPDRQQHKAFQVAHPPQQVRLTTYLMEKIKKRMPKGCAPTKYDTSKFLSSLVASLHCYGLHSPRCAGLQGPAPPPRHLSCHSKVHQ